MARRIGIYLRGNLLALVALVLALGLGTAWASGLAPNSVRSRHIKDGQVRAPDIANGTVNARKLAAGAVITSKIAAGAVGSDQIADGSIARKDIDPAALAVGDAATLGGLAPDAFLRATQQAADAAKLGGRTPDAYLLAAGTALDSDKLDGLHVSQLTTGKARTSSGMVWAPSYRTDYLAVAAQDGPFGVIRAECTASGVSYSFTNASSSAMHVYSQATRKPPDDWLTPTVETWYVPPGDSAPAGWGAMTNQVAHFLVAEEATGRVGVIDAAGNMAAANCFHAVAAVVHG